MESNKNKIAFIMCVSDEQQFAEACYYIERLYVPEGCETDIIAVREADSMAAGYQAAMESSDAKYKIYMHQDVQIINRYFLRDIIDCFKSDEQIGLIGMVGCRELPLDALAVCSWDAGSVRHNCIRDEWGDRMVLYQNENQLPVEAEAVDGLLLATQYDVPWRADLFDGWHYYDVSQCLEMKRRGYKIVIPYQTLLWVLHDNKSAAIGSYYNYTKRFIAEYQDIKSFAWKEPSEEKKRYEKTKAVARDECRRLVDAGEAARLIQLFEQPDCQGYMHLKEFEVLANIHRMEARDGVGDLFWKPEDDFDSLNIKLRELRYALRRITYDAVSDEKVEWQVLARYSRQARFVVCWFYGMDDAYIEQVLEELPIG